MNCVPDVENNYSYARSEFRLEFSLLLDIFQDGDSVKYEIYSTGNHINLNQALYLLLLWKRRSPIVL